jgi:hypothetical protein
MMALTGSASGGGEASIGGALFTTIGQWWR